MNVSLRLITAPAADPVSSTEAKLFLRVDHTADDALIASLIKSATQKGEELARRAFITQTLEMTLDAFPSDGYLKLYRPPLISVTSVTYYNADNQAATWTDYIADISSEPGVIYFKSTPSVSLLQSGAVRVRYQAGYGASGAAVPDRIRQAILSLVAFWYENRERSDVPKNIVEAFVAERVVWY